MKIFDLTTNYFIYPKESCITGTNAVNCLSKYGSIQHLKFNTSTSRGIIDGKNITSKIVIFEKCVFNYINFYNIPQYKFIDCEFKNCMFYYACEASFKRCNSNRLIDFNCCTCSKLPQVIDCSNFDISYLLKEHEKEEQIRKNLKQGYILTNVPAIVKVSFPNDAKFTNLIEYAPRTNKVFVEDIYLIGTDINKINKVDDSKKIIYEVGKISQCKDSSKCYIKFFKNLEDMADYTFENLSKIINENY